MVKISKSKQQRIALERIKILFKEADSLFLENQGLANSYIKKARKIAMSVNLRLPFYLKRKFCKHCYSYFKAGKSYRVRTKHGKVIYYCLSCKKYTRIPFIKEKKIYKKRNKEKKDEKGD